MAGSWQAILESASIREQRDVLAPLIDHVVARRLDRGSYRADVKWTPLGEALLTRAT